MSRESDVIAHAVMLLEQSVTFTTNGTADKPRRVRRLDLALEHMADWAARLLPRDGQRGGSSSPTETEDRVEAQRLGHSLRQDRAKLAEHLKNLNHAARGIYDITARYVETIDYSKLPSEERIPGCVSCARVETVKGIRLGGHFWPIVPEKDEYGEHGKLVQRGNAEAHAEKLCRWCFEKKRATGELPPVQACDIYHTQSPAMAGRWLAKQEPKAS